MDMETRHFEYIIKVVEFGSINKAAAHLNLSQSNLSTCIKKLEAELGYDIFLRRSTGIVLTAQGRLFMKSIQKIVDEMSNIQNIPSLFTNKENISLSCTYSFDIMKAFINFKKLNPAKSFEDSFKETGLIQTIRDVVEKRYRMSIFYCFDSFSDSYRALAKKNNLVIKTIAHSCPLIVLASKRNPLARKKEIEFESIRNLRFIMYENFKFEEWLSVLGFQDDKKVLYVFDRGGLLDTIEQSSYVTVMMKRYTDVYSKSCAEIPIVNAPCRMNAHLVYDSAYKLNKWEKAFIKELEKLFKKEA